MGQNKEELVEWLPGKQCNTEQDINSKSLKEIIVMTIIQCTLANTKQFVCYYPKYKYTLFDNTSIIMIITQSSRAHIIVL